MITCAVFVWGTGIAGGTSVLFEHGINAAASGVRVSFVLRSGVNPARELIWHRISRMSGVEWLSYEEATDRDFDIAMATFWPTCYELWRTNARKWVYFVQSVESRFAPAGDTIGRWGAEATYDLPLGFVTEAAYVQRYLQRIHNQRAELAVNGIRKDIFSPTGERIGKSNGCSLRVLVEGPLEPEWKGTAQAIALSREAGVDEIWVLTLTPLAGYPGVDRVFSQVPMDETPVIYRSCDVLVKLSRVEGMFGPPLEMFHCGGTAITYDVTGHEHYIRHGKNALVARVSHTEQVVKYLRDLRRWPALLEALRRGALETAAGWPSWEESSHAFWRAVLTAAERSTATREGLERISRYFRACCSLAVQRT